jgi:molybdate transport system permease protein
MPWLPPEDLQALGLTLRLAAWTTALLLVAGTPLAWWLARTRWRGRALVEAVVALPLVLPPTVLGFYLLLALGPEGPLGRLALAFGGAPPVFRFSGLVLGSMVYSLPFVVQPLQNAFENLGRRPLEVAATLRASPLDRFLTVALPLARPGFLTAAVLGFAHTVGEFGVVLMIGGNIPGETQVLSIAIYDHVEALEYGQAHWLSGGLLLLSFALLMVVYAVNRRFRLARP